MRPRISEPPFVEALTKMVQTATDGGAKKDPQLSIPVLGYSDRLIGVTGASRNAASAFKLAEWLAQRDISSQLARAGEGTLPVRRSLASSPLWYDQGVTPAERDRLGEALVALLDRSESFIVPRIPRVDEYLAALDKAVADATQGGKTPQKALEDAARHWEKITDSHGRESQRQAYLKHLGFAEP
jgi:ABC-type glycerol-3-phosphate transport system substrate-binding protein